MNTAQLILTTILRIYRWVLSPAKTLLFGPLGRCRFTPSCSAYALQAVQEHGALRGSWFSVRRLCRCHPWGGCGHDPVPAVLTEVVHNEPRAALGANSSHPASGKSTSAPLRSNQAAGGGWRKAGTISWIASR